MKKKYFILSACAVLLAPAAHANHSAGHEGAAQDIPAVSSDAVRNPPCADTVQVKVSGLVCDFCARALEKVFHEKSEVEGIDVNLDAAAVTVAMKPGQTLGDDVLTKLITDAGYSVTDIRRGCASHG